MCQSDRKMCYAGKIKKGSEEGNAENRADK